MKTRLRLFLSENQVTVVRTPTTDRQLLLHLDIRLNWLFAVPLLSPLNQSLPLCFLDFPNLVPLPTAGTTIMGSWTLFPRLHLFEIEDQPWCPSWLREHSHRSLARMWRTSNTSRGPPSAQACDILVRALGGIQNASGFCFVDSCAGAGGPTPLLESIMNRKMVSAGFEPVKFVLTDLWPDIEAWKAIVKGSSNISYIAEPIDATRPRRIAEDGKDGKKGKKECRIFNLCFHHFDDEAGKKVLASAVQSADAFMLVFSSLIYFF